jgi:anaerobic selenocysteine-containing dehydrogenase
VGAPENESGLMHTATARSVCPLDCPDRCSLDVRVEEGRVVSIEGNHTNPVTAGFICAKVRRYPKRVYGPDRLLHPMRRVGVKGEARFERIGWDQAFDSIVDRFTQVRRDLGAEAILPFAYGGSNGLLSHGATDERLFRQLGTSRLWRTVCAAQTGLVNRAMYGRMASVDFLDFEKARLVIVWGGNPKHSNVHLVPYLKRARAAGARVVVVDPRRTLGDAYADQHLPVYPGSDAAVALAMICHLDRIGAVDRGFLETHATGWERLLDRAREWTLERAANAARVDARAIEKLAEDYAAADPALVRCGWGLERNRNGEAAVAAVLALPAMAGKFGKQGGGYALSASGAYGVDGGRLAGVAEADTRLINMSQLGRVLLEEKSPPVKALFVYNANPAVTLPDQERVRRGLLREDLFTVVFDQVLTDTARYADVLLPATTFLEQTDICTSYGTYGLMLSEPVIAPVGEARSNDRVFRQLAHRFGFDALPAGDDHLAQVLDTVRGSLQGPSHGRERLAALRRDGIVRFDFPGERPVQFGNVSPGTDDHRIHVWPSELGSDPYRIHPDPGTDDYPLALISPASDRTICSILGETVTSPATLELHPEDGAARGLSGGQEVRVFNALGEVRVILHLNEDVRPGVASLPKGIWDRHTRSGNVGTTLVPDFVSPISGGACFNDSRVQVAASLA